MVQHISIYIYVYLHRLASRDGPLQPSREKTCIAKKKNKRWKEEALDPIKVSPKRESVSYSFRTSRCVVHLSAGLWCVILCYEICVFAVDRQVRTERVRLKSIIESRRDVSSYTTHIATNTETHRTQQTNSEKNVTARKCDLLWRKSLEL